MEVLASGNVFCNYLNEENLRRRCTHGTKHRRSRKRKDLRVSKTGGLLKCHRRQPRKKLRLLLFTIAISHSDTAARPLNLFWFDLHQPGVSRVEQRRTGGAALLLCGVLILALVTHRSRLRMSAK